VSALASPEVGRYVNEYFSASQKVATFRIVGGPKQRQRRSYFAPRRPCPHVVAGPVDAPAFTEAKWVVETTKKAMAEAKGDAKFSPLPHRHKRLRESTASS
jgi:hypothetical protein